MILRLILAHSIILEDLGKNIDHSFHKKVFCQLLKMMMMSIIQALFEAIMVKVIEYCVNKLNDLDKWTTPWNSTSYFWNIAQKLPTR